MRIVKVDTECRYFALSFVWGRVETFKATTSNLIKLEAEGSLTQIQSQLPKVIRDAMTLVSALQERFLWVDTLCVVQDDIHHQEVQLPQMGRIYSQAALTIVAFSGDDANAGLPGVTGGSRLVQQLSETVYGHHLYAKLPELQSQLHTSTWNRRAWTFQEKILSTRCLYLSEHQMYFECQENCYSEDVHDDPSPSNPTDFSSPQSKALRDALRDHPTLIDNVGGHGQRFHNYVISARNYSSRSISYHSDSLNAFQGYLSVLEQSFGWKFISALPEVAFDLALLWSPSPTAYLRPTAGSDHLATRICTSPTWCLTAWEGQIFWDWWRHDSYVGKDVELMTEMGQIVVFGSEGFHNITRPRNSVLVEEQMENEAMKYMLRGGFERHSSDMTLFFKASASAISNLSITQGEPHAQEHYGKLPYWLQRQSKFNVSIYDSQRRRCGILYGLHNDWEQSHDQDRCELVLISRCGQDEVRPADVEAYKDKGWLPPEYYSSEDYYYEIFDTANFKYQRFWALDVMLIEWKDQIATRVAIGMIHADAWAALPTSVKMIALG